MIGDENDTFLTRLGESIKFDLLIKTMADNTLPF